MVTQFFLSSIDNDKYYLISPFNVRCFLTPCEMKPLQRLIQDIEISTWILNSEAKKILTKKIANMTHKGVREVSASDFDETEIC